MSYFNKSENREFLLKVDSILIDEPDELEEMEETIQRSVDRVFGGVSAIQKQTVNGKNYKNNQIGSYNVIYFRASWIFK